MAMSQMSTGALWAAQGTAPRSFVPRTPAWNASRAHPISGTRLSDTAQQLWSSMVRRVASSVAELEIVVSGASIPGEHHADSTPQPFTLISSQPLADGILDLVHWEAGRVLRVWRPPGYARSKVGKDELYPVLYLQDGQNILEDELSFSGSSWKAAETATQMIQSGQLPPFLIVGMDHSGASRSLDYTPYKPGTGPKGFRSDAANWPGGGVDAYLDRVQHEVMPWAQEEYGAASCPSLVAFGGSSFGAICTLAACMTRPGLFGAALVESPSLWLAEEKFLREDIASYAGQWPTKIYIGMGGKEYSGTRSPKEKKPEFDELVASYAPELERYLKEQGVPEDRLMTVVDEEGIHSESSWAERLPQALSFLLADWWGALLAARGATQDYLYLTIPSRPVAGWPAVLLVNGEKSEALAESVRKGEGVRVCAGFNETWEHKVESSMVPLPAVSSSIGGTWFHTYLPQLPNNAFEMNFALSNQSGEVWDSNGGSNFYQRCSLAEGSWGKMGASAAGQHCLSVEEVARKNSGQLYFTYPEKLISGQHCTFYMNRKQSEPFRDMHNIQLQYGFNQWEMGSQGCHLTPTNLWRSDCEDWWGCNLYVPEGAEDIHFCFHDGNGTYDSNFGANYVIMTEDTEKDKQNKGQSKARLVTGEESVEHADGHLHVLQMSKRVSGDKEQDRKSKWTEEKTVRVWTPPGYSKETAPKGGWPVLYINDAQNKFECWLAHQGVSWRIGYTASELIAAGEVPPFVIVGIDNPGSMRSLNYLPYPPGSGVGGFRGDASRWPGGGVDQYLKRVTEEIMPMVTDKYNLATDPSRVAFGGGSFGGVCALYAALNYSHVFGSILAESPSLWIAEGRFLEDMFNHKGMLPERLFMGCGTKEYSATRDHERQDVDDLLLHYYCEAARALDLKGCRQGNGRLNFLIEEGAGHHELAWQWRLTGALRFLLGPWRE